MLLKGKIVENSTINGTNFEHQGMWVEIPYNQLKKKELEMYNDNFKYHFKLGSINYYFFDREVVDSLNWQEISEKYLVLKRVTVNSIEQLDSMNWEITYP